MHRLEQAVPAAGMEVGAGGNAEPSDQSGSQVGQDVAVEIVRHNHLEALWLPHQLQRQGVYVAVLRDDLRIFAGDRLEPLLPDAVRRNRVRLVTHRDARFAV